MRIDQDLFQMLHKKDLDRDEGLLETETKPEMPLTEIKLQETGGQILFIWRSCWHSLIFTPVSY